MKNIRSYRFFKIFLLLIVLLSLCLVATACRHSHVYESEVVTPSTCTSKGTVRYICSCGDSYEEEIPVLEHDLTFKSDNDYHWQSCKNCDYVTEKTAHSFERLVSEHSQPSTCETRGYETRACSCGREQISRLPLEAHVWGDYVVEEGAHYLKCKNCNFETARKEHSFANTIAGESQPSTCTTHGYETRMCVCGEKHIYDNLPLAEHEWGNYLIDGDKHYRKCANCPAETEKNAHQYTTVIEADRQPSTCTERGHETRACICGDTHFFAELPLAEHEWGKYLIDGDKHYRKCANCTAQTEKTIHNYATVIDAESEPSTCTTHGHETRACICGEKHVEELPLTAHAYTRYVTEPDGTSDKHWRVCATCGVKEEGSEESHVTEGQEVYHEGSCIRHPYWEVTCSLCHVSVKYDETGYGPHAPVLREEKPALDYTDGWSRHWECTLCGRLFSGKGCEDSNELSQDDVVIPRKIKILSSYDDLLQTAQNIDFTDELQRNQVYQLVITAGSYSVDENYAVLDLSGGRLAEVYFNGDVSQIDDENCNLTVKFNVGSYGEDSLGIINAVIVDVTYVNAPAQPKHSLSIKAEGTNGSESIAVVSADGEVLYEYYAAFPEYFWYDAFANNQTVKFTCQAYGGKKLKTLIINGKSYALTNGVTQEITVTQDIIAEFVFSEQFVNTRVKIDKIDTSVWDAPAQDVDAYLSYEYDGATNEYGRLYKNSVTRFYADNANITRVIIEYENDDDYLQNEVKNSVSVSTSKESYMVACTQNLHGTEVTFVFDVSNNYKYFEYRADNSQARIVSITIEYTTYNSFAY